MVIITNLLDPKHRDKNIRFMQNYLYFFPPLDNHPENWDESTSDLLTFDPEVLGALIDEAITVKVPAALADGVDPITVACQAHTDIVKIHPFVDANKRLGRAVMNTILIYCGKEAVVFGDREKYEEIVVATLRDKNDKIFENYVRSILDPNWQANNCAFCFEPASKKCSRCKAVVYCTREHQVAHWKKHKKVCKAPRA